MDEIFLINYVLNNKITKIFVFVGNNDINYDKELDDVMTKNKKNSVINTIFTDEKINLIKDNKIKIVFVNLLIHYDDTIDTIKKKIILNSSRDFVYNEMYLYVKKNKYLDTTIIYNELSNNDKNIITKKQLLIYLSNISTTLYEKAFNIKNDIIDYDDIISLEIEEGSYGFNTSLDVKINKTNFLANLQIFHFYYN